MLKVKSSNAKLIGLITLCIIMLLFTNTALAEEEYNIILTLQAPTPTERGGFGNDITLDGECLIIGEWHSSFDDLSQVGRAYIFDSDWNIVSTLSAPIPSQGDTFSQSIDANEDIVVVGSPRTKPEGLREVGEAHVFSFGGSLLLTLKSPTPSATGYFGFEAAVGRDIVVVAELGGIKEVYFAGCVHVYSSEGDHLATLVSPSMKASAEFGRSLAVSDEFIVAGEPGWYGGALERGSVHVFNYDWNHVATLNPPEQGERTLFGYRVAIDHDIIVVGEPLATVDGHVKAGRAHIFDTGWNHIAILQAPTPEDNGEFGIDVAVRGNLIVVGESKSDAEVLNGGKAYVFDLEGNLISALLSPEPTVGAQFGDRVATDGEFIAVSEIEANVGDVMKAGKVHVFGLGESPVEQPAPEEETTETESESESEKSGGIPGFPIESIVISIVLAVVWLWLIQRKR